VADEDIPLTRKVLGATREFYDDVVTGDLRSLSIGQRAFDVVYCGGLLEQIRNTELVLDHLVSTLKPGGLLMIRMADRRTALALLDRTLPTALRKRMWADLRPGVPGPFPAVYERTVSADGMHTYTLMRGLVIAQQTAEPTLRANPARLSSSARVTCTVITRLTRGRFGDDHDELLYVIRKPHDRFARVVSQSRRDLWENFQVHADIGGPDTPGTFPDRRAFPYRNRGLLLDHLDERFQARWGPAFAEAAPRQHHRAPRVAPRADPWQHQLPRSGGRVTDLHLLLDSEHTGYTEGHT
jgi:hypothetical protein